MGETVNFVLCASQHNLKNAGQLSQGPDRLSNHSTPRPRPARQTHTRREGARLSPDTPGSQPFPRSIYITFVLRGDR